MFAHRVVTSFSPAQYLALEKASDDRHEYIDGQIVAMAGGSRLHSAVCQRVGRMLDEALSGKGCTVFQSDLRLRIDAANAYFYPDVQVVCGQVTGPDDQAIDNPTVLVEVLSPSTADYDRGFKVLQYQRIPTARDILLVHAEEKRVEQWYRTTDGAWHYVDRVEERIRLHGCEAEVALEALFERFEGLS